MGDGDFTGCGAKFSERDAQGGVCVAAEAAGSIVRGDGGIVSRLRQWRPWRWPEGTETSRDYGDECITCKIGGNVQKIRVRRIVLSHSMF
jgi:hypothetical protein